MAKNPYNLPRSDLSFDNIISNNNNAAFPFTASAATTTATTQQPLPPAPPPPVSSSSAAPGAKRGRGRPPKAKPGFDNGQQQLPQPQQHQQQPPLQEQQQFVVNPPPIFSAQPINAFQPFSQAPPQPFPTQQPITNPFAGFQSISQTVAAATQPPNSQSDAGGMQPVLVALGLADDPNNVVKRGPGRPKKLVTGQGGQPMIAKRGRGRPPKKSPGRPKKPKSVTSIMGANGIKKRPGRPPKNQSGALPASYPSGTTVGASAEGNVVLSPRRPGRPPKVGGVVTPRKSSGRPVGRPKKNANASWTSQSQGEAYADIKSKLDFFQSRVKHAVGVLRTTAQITSETASKEVEAAMLELEGLASMDLNFPFTEEPTQPTQPAATTTVPGS